MRKEEVERMRELLVEAITTLCRSGMKYSKGMRVEGLLGVTLDEDDIILVNINKSYLIPKPEDEKVQKTDQTVVDASNESEENSKRSSPNETVVDSGESFSVKRECSGEYRTAKFMRGSDFDPWPVEEPVVTSGVDPSRVPPFHDVPSIDALNAQAIPQLPHDNRSNIFSTSTNSNTAVDNTFDSANNDSSQGLTSRVPGVKIEISSDSDNEETSNHGNYDEQSEFASQEGALYGLPLDMQAAPLSGVYNPGRLPGPSVGGSGDYPYSAKSSSIQDTAGLSGSGKGKKLQCLFCKKTFTRQWNLKIHVEAIHTQIRKFKCPYCQAVSNRKRNILGHISRMHGQSLAETDNIDLEINDT